MSESADPPQTQSHPVAINLQTSPHISADGSNPVFDSLLGGSYLVKKKKKKFIGAGG